MKKKGRPMSEAEAVAGLENLMREEGMAPALIYAMKKTQCIGSKSTVLLLSYADLREWKDAIAEYYRSKGRDVSTLNEDDYYCPEPTEMIRKWQQREVN
jgi:hypothetical protein